MPAPGLYLWNDAVARRWQPFALTRPAGEMLFGVETLRARAERVLGVRCVGHLAEERLRGFSEPGAPPCLRAGEAGREGVRIVLNGRLAVEDGVREGVEEAVRVATPVVFSSAGRIVGACFPGGAEVPAGLGGGVDGLGGSGVAEEARGTGGAAGESVREAVWAREGWARREVRARLLETPWELMAANPERIRADGKRFAPGSMPPEAAPPGVYRIGAGTVHLGRGAKIEPGVMLDTSGGPILLGDGVRIQGPARLAGPLWIGAGSVVLGGAVGGSSVGPGCRLRGEVEESVFLGFGNKAHDGFVGHAVVGRWVNLGALTTNSDLRHSYSTGRVRLGGETIETGLLKLGCFVGDHVRTGVGTLLGGGAVVGAGSSIAGGGMAPDEVPPFSWLAGDRVSTHEIERFLTTAERAMARRGAPLPDSMRCLYRAAHRRTAPLRARRAPTRSRKAPSTLPGR